MPPTPPTRTPRQHLGPLAHTQPGPQGVAFLFGSERFGMSNEDVYRCHVALRIPTGGVAAPQVADGGINRFLGHNQTRILCGAQS